ncbi:MAG TPA: four helix bundle protein [Anaerolineae bacterium]|nr:four helix bundle protein [Anaerolineae bacterium]
MRQENRQGETQSRGFEDLKTWQLAQQLMIECHKMAKVLPTWERYDLTSQVRRSSKSVMANIAEGYGRYHYLDSLRFYYIARGSLNETINHIITAHDLTYIEDQRFRELNDLGREAERALNGFISYVWRQRQGQTHYGERLVAEERAIYYPMTDPDFTDTAIDQTDQPQL